MITGGGVNRLWAAVLRIATNQSVPPKEQQTIVPSTLLATTLPVADGSVGLTLSIAVDHIGRTK